MNEKAISKLKQILDILVKFNQEDKYGSQGFNDRVTVAQEIFHRNKQDKEFMTAYNKLLNKQTTMFSKLIQAEIVVKEKKEKKVFKKNPNKPTKVVPGAKKYTKPGTKPANFQK